MSLAAALATLAALLAAGTPAPHRPACKKHLVVTFAVYSEFGYRDLATNGCWTFEPTVDERERYALCHFDQAAPAKKAIAIYDDVNPAHRGEHAYLQRCAAAGDELWEYLTPPFVPLVRGFHKLRRLYAELYDSRSRAPMPLVAQWRRKKTVDGHRLWPMIDVSEHAGSAAAIARAVRDLCAELPDHGILGIYSHDPVTRAPPADPAQRQRLCVDHAHPRAQHCNGRRDAIAQALDACTRR